ncbi:hypothetical protein N5C58_25090 [Citrobacter freundii]|uniref:hypothetical protein n=1 Tax=Citrobacter freundii TaxID=546 RepID=UPI00244ACEA3|nr:hypothetical protein [Citrobacter freundii]MDH1209356.1 hypothetical protein [Citrobacter freundii]
MNALLGKIASAVATFFVALILNKFFSTFRVRQLYLAYENTLEYTSYSITGYTVLITITNKGKEKEKNVVVTLPKNKAISIISSNCHDIEHEKNQFKIARLLPNEIITLILLVKDGDKLSKNNPPVIKSDDTNGKSYDSIKQMPPSLGPALFGLSVTIACFALLGGVVYKGYNPFEIVYDQYFKLRFDTYYNRGFSNTSFQENSLTKQYDMSKDEFPIDLKNVDITDNKIVYTFNVNNITNQNFNVEMNYTVRNTKDYYKELGKALNIRENKEKWKALDEIRDKYYVATDDKGYTYSVKEWVDKGQQKEIKMARPLIKGLDYQDLNVEISIRNDSDNEDFYGDYLFEPKRSTLATNKIDSVLKNTYYPIK